MKKLRNTFPPTSLGALSKLPKKIRQALYQYVLFVEVPVMVKTRYVRRASERKRNRSVKHGNNQEQTSRFNILRVSKQIYSEASWVLYNHTSLQLQVDNTTASYLAGYNLKTVHRLGSIPRDEKAKNMWECAAKFRFVEIGFPDAELTEGNPTVYTGRLAEMVSLLLKSWENDNRPPTAPVAHVVTIKLASLFDQLVPFNASTALDPLGDTYNWVYRNLSALDVDYREIENEAADNLRKMVAIIGNNCGFTKWCIFALEELKQSSKGGLRRLEVFKAICAKNGVQFRSKTVGKTDDE